MTRFERLAISRRKLLAGVTVGLGALRIWPRPAQARSRDGRRASEVISAERMAGVSLTINGERQTLTVDPRMTLLDALRERLHLFGTKKGCDHGQCGACTVLVDSRRINSCLTLAVMQNGATIVTIEGLGTPENLHPMQKAFIDHDGYQCGYCTPGQICSAVAMLNEVKAGVGSYVSRDLNAAPQLSADELRERMSGNICRCGAYANIADAIRKAAKEHA